MISLSLGLTVLAAAAVLAAAGTPASDMSEGAEQVAAVNGEPVSVRLFERRMVRHRAAAYSYFRRAHDAEDCSGFWTTSFGGEVPLEWLKRRALDDCVRIKVEQILARDHGVVAEIGYAAFLDALACENERRSEALAAGQPIYGPQHYGEDEYFTYLHSNMVIELKRRLSRTQLKPSEHALRRHYEAVKDDLYARGDRLTVLEIAVPFGPEDAECLSRSEAKQRVEEARARIAAGEAFDAVARLYGDDASPVEKTLDDETARFDGQHCPVLRETAFGLAEGEVSRVFEENRAFHLITCVRWQPLGYRSFEEVRQNVLSGYVDQQYAELLDRLVSEARVDINVAVYEDVRVS